MNYYERYCGEYARDTAHLSLQEHGVYTVMLDTYYATEKYLPADYKALYRICRAMTGSEQAAVRKIAEEFFPVAEDGLRHNRRADEVLIKAQKRIAAAKANGAKSKEPTGTPEPEPSTPPSGPPSRPIGTSSRPQTPEETKTPSSPSAQFLSFWTSWPSNDRKQAKGKCFELWRKKKFDAVADEIISHVERMKRSDQWRSGYVPAPMVYLNDRRWEGAETQRSNEEVL